jgi:hypothetical protein
MGDGQAIMIDPVNGTLMGASDPLKDGLPIGCDPQGGGCRIEQS